MVSPINESPRACVTEHDPLQAQSNKVTDAVTGKILYCNGMTTSKELAQDHVRTIAHLTGLEVELHYNDTTSTKKALRISSKLGLGSLAVGYALASRGRWLSKAIGITGIASLVSGVIELNKIDRAKNASADKMAGKVVSYLDAHPMNHMTLILHSQGADIGHRALEMLSSYKDRINVVTIGGMIDIPDNLARRVVNFLSDNDMISYLSKMVFDSKAGPKTRVQIPDAKSPYLDSHYSSDYLKRSEVQQAIRELARARATVRSA